MDGITILWIVVGLAVLVIVVALIAGASSRSSKRRAEPERQQADGRDWADGSHP